jgi:pimeloyl-ACP methyl ester carboxylesterase
LPPLRRVYAETSDGWRLPLRVIPAPAGASGEPVLLAHALGLGGDAYRLGGGPTLASCLRDAGFTVYLAHLRGDVESEPPAPGAGFCFDDLVRGDVPALVERVRSHSGFERIFWVGHGMGGQLGLIGAARSPDRFAAVVTLCAPVQFAEKTRSEARRLARIASLVPAHWAVPARAAGWAGASLIGRDFEGMGHFSSMTPGSRVRTVAEHGLADVPAGLLHQMHQWFRTGSWTDLRGGVDYLTSLAEARSDLLCVLSADDDLCPPLDGWPAVRAWGGKASVLLLPPGFAHLDVVLSEEADRAVFQPVLRWLEVRRRAAWTRLAVL